MSNPGSPSGASTTGSPAPTARRVPPAWLPTVAITVTLVLWASAFVAIRHLAGDFTPGALALGRLVVGAIALSVLVLPRGLPRATPAQWRSIVAIGVLWYAVYMVALNAGEHRVDSGTSAMLIQVSPVVVAALAATFLGERFTPQLLLGLALAFGGVALIAVAQAGEQASGAGAEAVGVLLVLLAAVVYAVALVVQKPLVSGSATTGAPPVSALHVTWAACSVGAVCCLPFAGSLVAGVRHASVSSSLWVVYLGIFPTAIAFTTYAYALRRIRVSSLSVTTYLVPVITVVLAWSFLGETPPALAYAGGALALVGVGVARRTRPWRRVAPGPGADQLGSAGTPSSASSQPRKASRL